MSLTSTLNVNAGRIHVAALTFDTGARMEFDFNDVQDTDALIGRFASMVWHQGYTHTDEGLKLANEEMFSYSHGMRSDAAKVSATL